MSKSTVRTMSDAPPSSSARTPARLPAAAAMCSAVSPFSARLSMYRHCPLMSSTRTVRSGRLPSCAPHPQEVNQLALKDVRLVP